ncbi:lipase family protein [Fluviicola sp.]|uniref:alpha/beta hydrolase family protein n=1 Tax=Fluviicola sp. TaxID=1917219 RepID=UPI0031E0022C
MKTLSTRILVILFLLGTQSCKKKIAELEYKERGTLIEYNLKGTIPESGIVPRINEFDAQDIVQNGVNYYSITYRTIYEGKQINSRGLLLVPEHVDSAYLIAYFHGTQIPINLSAFYESKYETPSNYEGQGNNFIETRNIGLAWASAGYIVFLPDYIGFGATENKEHPYLAYDELFKSNIDGLLAVKQFLAEKGITYDNRLFLSGWSQGGGASLSAHKFIQEQYASEFTVTASSSLAGPYNLRGFMDDILSRKDEELITNNIFSWGLYSLNKFSPELKRPTDQFYSYPVYDQYSAIFTPSQIPSQTFKAYFLANIIDGSDAAMNQVINRNTFSSGWNPVGKVFLHHGDADEIVYYYNATDAMEGLGNAGGDVTLYTYLGGTHLSDVGLYTQNTLNDFNALK